MVTRALLWGGVLVSVALVPVSVSAQSPFEEDDVAPPPANTKIAAPTPPPASRKAVAPPAPPTVPTAADDDDDDRAPAPSLDAGPRPRLTESPARGFRVVSYARQITLDLRSPNRGATFNMQSGSSRGTVSTFG